MKTQTTRFIVGLGNPGKRYMGTRHNVGFMAIEKLASKYDADLKAHARIPATIAEWKTAGLRWIVMEPITFMNLSGQAVIAALNFWKLDLSSLLVVTDDVELQPTTLRLRTYGSAGGHHGLKSIIDHLGTHQFCRLRVGIGRPLPSLSIPLADWLLQPFEKSELPWLHESVKKTVCAIESWTLEGPSVAMNRYNTVEHPCKDGSVELKK